MPEIAFSQLPSEQIRKDLSFGRVNWKTAEDLYKQGKYLEALGTTIGYIDESKGAQFSKDPHNGIKVSHGSMQLYVSVKDNQLQVLAPFVDIAKAQKMIILRKVCEINFNSLALAKIEVKEDILCFNFSCPLAGCEPWKIYDILREICFTADRYDDDFIILHEAAWVYEPETTPYSDQRKEQCWKGFKLYLREAKDWIAYLQPLNCTHLIWDVLYTTFLKIDHFCAPQGIVKNLLETNINKMVEKRDINDLNYDAITYLNSLDSLPQSSFFTQLYDVNIFIPSKITGSAANIKEALKTCLADTYNFLNKNEVYNAYMCLQKGIYRLLYNYRFNEVQWQHLEKLLAGNNLLPLRNAADTLYDQLNKFSANPLDQVAAHAPDKKEEKKSLFANWFK